VSPVTPPIETRLPGSPTRQEEPPAAGIRPARRPRPIIGRPRTHPTFGLALGGGGARGFAHVVVIEALDELGVRPAAIAGTSIGAAIGAAYAAGMSGKAMRRIVTNVAHQRGETFGRLFGARASGLRALLAAPFGNLMLLDAEKLCAAFLPPAIPTDFSELAIPLTVLATDLYGRCAVPLTAGALRPAIAASMAVPGLLRPVTIDGRVLIDGGATEPLPFEYLRPKVDMILAVDASAAIKGREGKVPDPWECLFATLQIMGRSILKEKLRHGGPDLLLQPNVGTFRMLDFLRGTAILRAAEPIKEEVKEKLQALIGV
jgi:NTE family protein